jgi:hypothetical protein
MRPPILAALVLAATLPVSLGAQGNVRPADSAAIASPPPSVALPVDLDRVLRDYEKAWRAGDIPALVSLFTEDGFVLQPGRPPVRGHAALRARYTGQAGGQLRLRAFAYGADNTTGFIVGGYGYGDTPGDVGKFTLTLRRSPGGPWRIFSDMDNGNQPPRGPTRP